MSSWVSWVLLQRGGTYHSVWETAVREGVAGSAVDSKHSADLASSNLRHLFHLVRVHSDDPGDLDLLLRLCVEDIHALLQTALVDTDIRQLSKVAFFQLKRQSHKWERVVRNKGDWRFSPSAVKSNVGDLSGIRQVIYDSVKHRLDTFVR